MQDLELLGQAWTSKPSLGIHKGRPKPWRVSKRPEPWTPIHSAPGPRLWTPINRGHPSTGTLGRPRTGKSDPRPWTPITATSWTGRTPDLGHLSSRLLDSQDFLTGGRGTLGHPTAHVRDLDTRSLSPGLHGTGAQLWTTALNFGHASNRAAGRPRFGHHRRPLDTHLIEPERPVTDLDTHIVWIGTRRLLDIHQ